MVIFKNFSVTLFLFILAMSCYLKGDIFQYKDCLLDEEYAEVSCAKECEKDNQKCEECLNHYKGIVYRNNEKISEDIIMISKRIKNVLHEISKKKFDCNILLYLNPDHYSPEMRDCNANILKYNRIKDEDISVIKCIDILDSYLNFLTHFYCRINFYYNAKCVLSKKLLPVSFSNFNALYDKRLDVYRGDAFKDTTAEEIYFMYSKLIPLIGNTKDSLAYLAKIEKDNFLMFLNYVKHNEEAIRNGKGQELTTSIDKLLKLKDNELDALFDYSGFFSTKLIRVKGGINKTFKSLEKELNEPELRDNVSKQNALARYRKTLDKDRLNKLVEIFSKYEKKDTQYTGFLKRT